MRLTLEVWRQADEGAPGHWETHRMEDLESSMSVLEMLDRLNEELVGRGCEQVTFESDCREGICGACGITVNGQPHGPERKTPACHQRLRSFEDGQTVRLEPLRSAAYPVVRDLMVDRGALDRAIVAGGHVAVDAGTAPDADTLPASHDVVETALDFAACIGCGACVAACPNGSAHLYVGAKLVHLSLLPLGKEERSQRARDMVEAAERDFGPCSFYGECAEACPAGIPLSAVAAVNRERLRAAFQRKLKR